jgi:hypothetical protein
MLDSRAANSLIISPDTLSLQHIADNWTLKKLEECNVKMDAFYHLLWRHIFTVELLYAKYGTAVLERGNKGSLRDERIKVGCEYPFHIPGLYQLRNGYICPVYFGFFNEPQDKVAGNAREKLVHAMRVGLLGGSLVIVGVFFLNHGDEACGRRYPRANGAARSDQE